MTPCLKFNELEHYLAHLKTNGIASTHLEITNEATPAHFSRGGNFSHITYHVVASQYLLLVMNQSPVHVARWSGILVETDSVALTADLTRLREVLFKRFEEVKAEIEAQGFKVVRGVWCAVQTEGGVL